MMVLHIEQTRELADFPLANYTLTDESGVIVERAIERSYTDKAIINIINGLIDKYGKIKVFEDQISKAKRILQK